MTTTEMNNKLSELCNNEAFIKRMSDAESKEDVRKIFSEFGLDLTEDEVTAMLYIAANEGEEVTLEKLECVAGGVGGWEIFVTSISLVKEIAKKSWDFGRKCAKWF